MQINVLDLQDSLAVNQSKIKKTVLQTLKAEKIIRTGQITICLVTDKTIRAMNLKHLHKNEPTDVLAFALQSPNPKNADILADIAVSTERALDNAKALGSCPLYEIHLYVVHGTLHILGYDDNNQRAKRIMLEKASNILAALNMEPTRPKGRGSLGRILKRPQASA